MYENEIGSDFFDVCQLLWSEFCRQMAVEFLGIIFFISQGNQTESKNSTAICSFNNAK